MTMQLRTPSNSAHAASDEHRPLADIVNELADLNKRRVHYEALAKRRDREEPVVNAFEIRKEDCPAAVNGPLNGLPISVKDQIAVEGWPRSLGLERRSIKPDKRSASLVARLTELGAIVTGKTALPPYAMDFQTVNARRGPTRNPHNPAYTVGGSSGGSAAAVASAMSLLDVGADLSGSLRVPAAWCGVCSYTPTEGYWSNDGLLKGSVRLSHFARIGLMARSADDLGFIWHVLQGNADQNPAPIANARLAIWSPQDNVPCDKDTLDVWQNATRKLSSTSHTMSSCQLDHLFAPSVYRLGGEIIGYMTGGLMPGLIRWMIRRDRRAAAASPGFIAHIHQGYRRDKKRHTTNLEQMHALRAEADRLWSDHDALLLPVTPICAFEHIAPIKDQNGVRTYDTVFQTSAGPIGYFDAMTRFTLPLTLLGWPVVTLPIGRDMNGLPVGAQLVGKPGSDGELLALAVDIQAAFR